jgi:hypothetical protein
VARYNSCPSCGRRIPAWRAIIGSEIHPFSCKGCGAPLMKKTARISLGLVAFALWFWVKQSYGWAGWQTWAAMTVVIGALALLALNFTRVRLATPEESAKAKPRQVEIIPDKPPPLAPAFRGMSGPPPGSGGNSSPQQGKDQFGS